MVELIPSDGGLCHAATGVFAFRARNCNDDRVAANGGIQPAVVSTVPREGVLVGQRDEAGSIAYFLFGVQSSTQMRGLYLCGPGVVLLGTVCRNVRRSAEPNLGLSPAQVRSPGQTSNLVP